MWERPSGSESAALPGEMNCFKSSILLEFWDIFIGKHAARESWMTAKPLWGTLRGGPNLSIPTSFAELQAIDNVLPLSRSPRAIDSELTSRGTIWSKKFRRNNHGRPYGSNHATYVRALCGWQFVFRVGKFCSSTSANLPALGAHRFAPPTINPPPDRLAA
jgi:hypothetical protein